MEIGGAGVLLRGPSGAGKSDLALRLIDGGATLVADDQTGLERVAGRLIARCPDTIRGMIEVRGVGILHLAHRDSVPLALVVDLVAPGQVERLPEPAAADYLGVALPRLALAPFQASTAAKVRLAMLSATRDIMRP